MRVRTGLLAGAMTLLLAEAAAAEPRIAVRTGEHPGFGRIVLEARGASLPAYRIQQDGERLLLRLGAPAAIELRGGRRPPRNAAGIAATDQGIEVTLRTAEVRVRHRVLGTRIVIDMLDPARRPAANAAEAQAPRTPGRGAGERATPVADTATRPALPDETATGRSAAAPVRASDAPAAPVRASDAPAAPVRASDAPAAPARATDAPAAPARAAEAPAAPQRAAGSPTAPARATGSPAASLRSEDPPAQAAPPPPSPTPAAVDAAPPAPEPRGTAPAAVAAAHAVPVRLVFGPPGQPRAALLPFGEDTGIAILRRGDTVLIVLDTPRPLNLAALRGDPVFGSMEARGVPGGVVLTLRLAEPAAIEARRRDGAWSLTAAPGVPVIAPPALEAMTDAPGPRLLVRTPDAGRIVAVADPETGLPLLIGTVRAPNLALSQLRRLPEGDLLPSLLGLATIARSDRFTLRAMAEGFVLAGALALDPAVAAAEPAQAMTRLFDIPSLPLPVLNERFRAEHAAARAAPPLGRAPLRRTAAETLLALGMPQEAQGMLALAAAEDPRALEDPAMAALAGAAALLAGRLAEAEGLARPDLPERDETMLWRALFDAARGDAAGAAPRLAATLPLALGYPEALRTRLLGPIAEALAEAGHVAGLRRLAALEGEEPALRLARAALAEAEGRHAEALAGYQALMQARDRLTRARGLRRSIELRLASGALTPAQAAEALDAALFSWRGDLREYAARLRIAALRTQAGDPRAAMTLLRETETLFPEQAAGLRTALQDAFLASLEREQPLSAVALHDAEPRLLPADARGDAALLALADRLAALDLPDRAAALLRPAMERAVPGSARRAEHGLRLARLELGEGRAEAALAALRDSAADALPAELAVERSLLGARAEARAGRRDAAVAALERLGPAGSETLSEILADARDWAGAARALGPQLAGAMPPGNAPLGDAAARLLLRQAAFLGLAGDQPGLAVLAAQYGGRFAAGPMADAFAALTADPMRGLADLPRLQRELQLFRALPTRAEPLRAASLGTR